jgi:hypothetical protein
VAQRCSTWLSDSLKLNTALLCLPSFAENISQQSFALMRASVAQRCSTWLFEHQHAYVSTLRIVCVDNHFHRKLCTHLASVVQRCSTWLFERLNLNTALLCLPSFAEAISQQSFAPMLASVAQRWSTWLFERLWLNTALFCLPSFAKPFLNRALKNACASTCSKL